MDRLRERTIPNRIFEEGVRWVEAINQHEIEESEFLRWATRSPTHLAAFFQAWTTWRDLQQLSAEQRERIEQMVRSVTQSAGPDVSS